MPRCLSLRLLLLKYSVVLLCYFLTACSEAVQQREA